MVMPIAERRQIENEMIFRRANEQVGIDLDKIDAMNVEDGNPGLVRTDDLILGFLCECSDENCDDRIHMPLSVYQKIHLNRATFTIKLKHQVKAIETVIIHEATYYVVKKNNSTTEPGLMLNTTPISMG
jgi:hypothetical protein